MNKEPYFLILRMYKYCKSFRKEFMAIEYRKMGIYPRHEHYALKTFQHCVLTYSVNCYFTKLILER